jgi:hypothetical protein
MKNYFFQLTITLSLGFTLALVSGFGQSSLAEYKTPENDGYQSNEQDSFYGSGGTGFNPLELIHRANLNNGRSLEEFNSDSQLHLENSASEFKRLQQERLLQQQQQSIPESNPVNNEQ